MVLLLSRASSPIGWRRVSTYRCVLIPEATSLIAEVKALYAEQWGFMSRQADDGRETNPYARLELKVPSNIEKVKPLAEAW